MQQNAHDSQQRPNQTCSVMFLFYIAPAIYEALDKRLIRLSIFCYCWIQRRQCYNPPWCQVHFMHPPDWATVPRYMVKHYSEGFWMRLPFKSVDFKQIAFQKVGGLIEPADALNETKDWLPRVKREFCNRQLLNLKCNFSSAPGLQPALHILYLLASITVWANSLK